MDIQKKFIVDLMNYGKWLRFDKTSIASNTDGKLGSLIKLQVVCWYNSTYCKVILVSIEQ